ncbi:MAG: hypothetical protein RIF41_05840 [Polyangiaceae bacterium]
MEGFDRTAEVRAAIVAELGPDLEQEREPQLDVAVTEDEVRVRYQEKGRPVLERAIRRPARDDEVVDAIAWLAGNLARDQTSSLLATLAPPARAEPAGPVDDPMTRARADRATSPAVGRIDLAPLVPTAAMDPELQSDDSVPVDAWEARLRTIAVSSSASLVNVGALVTWGPLAGQVGLAAHPFGRAWLGGQVGAGGLWEWDGPSVGLMANYAYLHAADSTEEVSAGATPLIVEENTLDERHQVGLLATGGYQLVSWLGVFAGLGAKVEAGRRPKGATRVLPDITIGARLF